MRQNKKVFGLIRVQRIWWHFSHAFKSTKGFFSLLYWFWEWHVKFFFPRRIVIETFSLVTSTAIYVICIHIQRDFLESINYQKRYHFWTYKLSYAVFLFSLGYIWSVLLLFFYMAVGNWELLYYFELRTYRPSGILKQLYTEKMSKYKMTHCYQANNSSDTSAKIQKANKPPGEAF